MSIGRLATLIVLALILCSGFALLSTPVVAMPLDTIKGFVLDEAGNPVPDANVSLWQNGTLVPCGMGNPQQSRFFDKIVYSYPSSNEYVGMFWFGMIYTGEYTIRAEKRGHMGTTITNVTPVEVHYAFVANVTIPGYHAPVFSPEQLNLTGGVAGTIRYTDDTRAYGVNVTLWQNGDMVERPGNPQLSETRNVAGREVDYLFDHLAPGQYNVVVESNAALKETESVPVNVTDILAVTDIVLSHPYSPVPPGPGTATPSTIGPDALLVLSSLGVTFLLIGKFPGAR